MASYVVSLGVFVLSNLVVLLLASVYYRNFDKIDAGSSYGALLDRTKLEDKKKSKWDLLFPALLFGRRICLTLGVLLIREFLWAQIATIFLFSTAMVIYLLHTRHFKNPFDTKMEVFNESTLVMLSYGLMMFTGFVEDAKLRYNIGWYYLTGSLGNITVHLSFLIRESSKPIKRSARKKLYIRKRKQAHAKALKKVILKSKKAKEEE